MAVKRDDLIDRAVLTTARAWAVALPVDRLLAYWLEEFQHGDIFGVGDAVIPVIQANFYAHPVRSMTTPRLSREVADRHGGVPG